MRDVGAWTRCPNALELSTGVYYTYPVYGFNGYHFPLLNYMWIVFIARIEDLLRHNEKEPNDFSGGLIFLRPGRIRSISGAVLNDP